MAEETTNMSTTSDRVPSVSSEGKSTTSKSGVSTPRSLRRASTGTFRDAGRKYSSGKPSSLSAEESPVPHHLRASTGSCQDICKYGTKDEPEVKPWQAKTRKNTISRYSSSVSGDSVSSQSTKLITPPQPVSAKEDITVNEKKKNVSEKRNTPIVSGKRSSELKPNKTKSTSNEAKRKIVSSPVAYIATKPSFNRDLGLKDLASGSKKLVSPFKVQGKVPKFEHKLPKINIVEQKTLNVTKVKAKKAVPESRENQLGIKEVLSKPAKNEKVKIVPESSQNGSPSDPLPSKLSSALTISSHAVKAPALSNAMKGADHVLEHNSRGKKVLESKPKESTNGIPLSESPSSQNISTKVKSPASAYSEEEARIQLENSNSQIDGSDDSISGSGKPLESLGNQNSKNFQAKGVSEENDTPRKVKFKRGKVVEIKSDDNAPRKLKFRRSRSLEGNKNNDVNNRGESFSKEGIVDDIDVQNDESGKVVLRHQQVEEKKDAQGLFNNVIEETASKLVEKRKSKVKALVGAFETVISLQDSNPTTPTAQDEK